MAQVSTRPQCGASSRRCLSFTSPVILVSPFDKAVILYDTLIGGIFTGQGFPDWPTPDFAKKALIEVTDWCRMCQQKELVLTVMLLLGYQLGC